MNKLLVILILSPLTLLAKPSLGKFFRPGWSETAFSYETFHSIGNYDANGNLQSLPASNSFFKTEQLNLAGRYIFTPHWAFSAGLSHVNAQSYVTNFSQSNGGLQNVHGSLEYRFELPSFDLGVAAEGLASLYRADEQSSKPLYGDGAHGFGGSLWFAKRTESFLWSGKFGYLYRSEGLSSVLPYELGVRWHWEALSLGAIGHGYWSALQDTSTDLQRHSLLNRNNAGSLHYRSANPSSSILDLEVRWNATEQFALVGGTGFTWSGRNASQGSRIFVGFNLAWQVIRPTIEKSPLKNVIVKPPKPGKKEPPSPLFKEENFHQELD